MGNRIMSRKAVGCLTWWCLVCSSRTFERMWICSRLFLHTQWKVTHKLPIVQKILRNSLSSLPFQLQQNNIFWLIVWRYDLNWPISLSVAHTLYWSHLNCCIICWKSTVGRVHPRDTRERNSRGVAHWDWAARWQRRYKRFTQEERKDK